MQYTQSYVCPVLFLQVHDSMRKTQTKNIAETCFDGKTLSCSLYFTLKTHVSVKVKAMKSIN